MSFEEICDFPLGGQRTLEWLCFYTASHGGTFDGRHAKWMHEQKVDPNSLAAIMRDLLGLALEMSVCFDQIDGTNIASLEVISRAYQVVEETSGFLQVDGA